jgi:hypothetical protein
MLVLLDNHIVRDLSAGVCVVEEMVLVVVARDSCVSDLSLESWYCA